MPPYSAEPRGNPRIQNFSTSIKRSELENLSLENSKGFHRQGPDQNRHAGDFQWANNYAIEKCRNHGISWFAAQSQQLLRSSTKTRICRSFQHGPICMYTKETIKAIQSDIGRDLRAQNEWLRVLRWASKPSSSRLSFLCSRNKQPIWILDQYQDEN